jgi:hypothetical protein
MHHHLRWAAAMLLAALLPGVEPGDPGVAVQQDRLLADYPAMAGWAAAGVRGGIPPAGPARITIAPGGDVAAALAGGGVVALAPGVHRLATVVRLPAGTVVQGGLGTVLDLAGGGGLLIDGVAGVGLRGLRITHGPAAAELAARPVSVGIHANRSADGVPATHVAVLLRAATDCWIEDCELADLPDAPLTIDGATRLTVRRVRIGSVVQRGAGHGIVRLHDVADSLLHRLDVDVVRSLRLSGRSTGNVIAGSAFAAPVHLTDSAAVAGNLFEANVHYLPPGSPYPPFMVSSTPIGAGNVVVDSRVYAGGSDALSGQLPPVGGVLAMATLPQRGTWDAEQSMWRSTRLFAPPMRAQASDAAPFAPATDPQAIAALAGAPAEAGPVVRLTPGVAIGEWLAAASPVTDAWATAPADAWPVPGATTARGTLTAVPDTALRDGAVNVLAVAGGDKRMLWMGCVIELASEATIVPVLAGPEDVAWRISGQQIAAGVPVRLAAGRHPLWGCVRVVKPNPFAKRIDVRIAFTTGSTGLADRAAPPPQPIPDPPGGTLYAATAAIDRSQVADWPSVVAVHRLLSQAEPADLDGALAALVAQAGDRAAGRLARRWQAVVQRVESENAGIADEIRRWRLRSTAYFMAGLPQRSWAFEKLVSTKFPGAPEEKPERIIP